MPPANITGHLHCGHALFLTLQDILARYHRSSGYNTLWLPGTDHAGLATHFKIMQSIQEMEYSEQLYEKAAAHLRQANESRICEQIKSMGASCDWSRYKFTLDENMLDAAYEAISIAHKRGMLLFNNDQWYLDMKSEAAELAAAIREGEIEIIPKSSQSQLLYTLDHIEPWCISRQIPWGYRMPIYINKKNAQFCIAKNAQGASELLNSLPEDIEQISDRFDTWFTSSLWPFATLGWPGMSEQMDYFYPADLLQTGEDILFSWCARMLMMSKLCTGKWAFKKIFLNAMITDAKGKKMSKSEGNGIEPGEIQSTKGTDALRWALACNAKAGGQMKITDEMIAASSKFCNKFWQAGRFFDFALSEAQISRKEKFSLDAFLAPKSRQKYRDILTDYRRLMQELKFIECTQLIHKHFWGEFCDQWIEEHKAVIKCAQEEAIIEGISIFQFFLSLAHPFIPFITQALWDRFDDLSNNL